MFFIKILKKISDKKTVYFQNTTTKTKIKSKLEIYKTNKTGKKIKYKNKG